MSLQARLHSPGSLRAALGSKADIDGRPSHICSTPESGRSITAQYANALTAPDLSMAFHIKRLL
jgi:hypothetical protein